MKSLVKVDLSDGKTCFLQTEYRDDGSSGFKLVLIDGIEVWKGHVTDDDLEQMRRTIKMDLETFTRQTLQALTKTGGNDIVFNYQLNRKKDNNLEFVWKKHVPAEDITFQIGKTVLKPSTSPAVMITTVLDHCIDCSRSQQAEISALKTDNERLSQERVNALKRLEKCVVAKEELERDLYSKFSAVLNSKKEKIRELKQTGGRVNENHAQPGPSTSGTDNKKRPAKSIEATNSDDDNTTDDEQVTQQSKKAKKSRQSLDDDSLVLDDGSEDRPTVVARPKRSRESKKTTPAKPVLPKVQSKDSNTSLSERPSTSRTPSSTRKSRAHSGNTCDDDADAMLDEI